MPVSSPVQNSPQQASNPAPNNLLDMLRTAKARYRIDIALTIVAQMLLWSMMRKSLLTTSLDGLPYLEQTIVSLVLIVATIAVALVLALSERRVEALLRKKSVVLACGLAGGAAILCNALVFGGILEHSPQAGWGWAFPCVAIEAFAFCTVYLAWIQIVCDQVFSYGLGTSVVMQLVAIAGSMVIAPMYGLEGHAYVLEVVVLPVTALCFAGLGTTSRPEALVREGTPGEKEPGATSGIVPQAAGDPFREPPTGKPGGTSSRGTETPSLARSRTWLLLAGILLFFLGLLSYLPYLGSILTAGPGEDALSFGVTLALFIVFALFALHAERTPGTAGTRSLAIALSLTIAILFMFFALIFTLLVQSEFCFSIARLIRRVSRAAVFLFVLVIVYRFNLPAIRSFALAYLVPVLAPKAMIYLFDLFGLNIDTMANFESLCLVMLGMGFAVTACLAAACLLNIDGSLTRLVFGGERSAPGAQPQQATDADSLQTRCTACDRIALRAQLTARERSILLCFSAGNSIQKTSELLSISQGTVNTHSASLYRKLGIHSKQELIDLVNREAQEPGA